MFGFERRLSEAPEAFSEPLRVIYQEPLLSFKSKPNHVQLVCASAVFTSFITSMVESTEVINEVIKMDLTSLVNELRSFNSMPSARCSASS